MTLEEERDALLARVADLERQLFNEKAQVDAMTYNFKVTNQAYSTIERKFQQIRDLLKEDKP